MAGGGFHALGEHAHAAKTHCSDEMTSRIAMVAMVTAIVATVGALSSYLDATSPANAGLCKINSAIKKTEAFHLWNYFHSKSTCPSLAYFARDLAPADKQASYRHQT